MTNKNTNQFKQKTGKKIVFPYFKLMKYEELLSKYPRQRYTQKMSKKCILKKIY